MSCQQAQMKTVSSDAGAKTGSTFGKSRRDAEEQEEERGPGHAVEARGREVLRLVALSAPAPELRMQEKEAAITSPG